MSIPIQEIINKAVCKEKEKREITSWHISKLGSCLRGIYLERLGKEPDEPINNRTLRVFDLGNKIENWIIDLIKKQEGIKVEEQIRVEDKELNVSGFADLKVEYNGEIKLYEIKSKHSKSFWYMRDKREGAPKHHQYQLWIYLWLLGIEKGSLIYVSKDDSSILEYPVERNNEQLKQEVFNELKVLNHCWKTKTLPPLPDKGSWQEKYCRFHKQCLSFK